MIPKIPLITILFFLSVVATACAEEIDINIIIQIESSGNPNAYNEKSGAIGLMQITSIVVDEWNNGWGFEYNVGDLYNPRINVRLGKWYLLRIKEHYLPHYKIPVTIENILASYNWGIGNVVKWHKKGGKFKDLPKETQQYIKKYNKEEKKRWLK